MASAETETNTPNDSSNPLYWLPRREADVDDAEPPRSLRSRTGSLRKPAPAPDSAISWPAIRPEVMEACSMALRRMGDSQCRSVAVTSAARREGRTTIAIGLATASASQEDRPTLLLDLDVERGTIGGQRSLQSSPGVTEFLHGHASLEECLQRTSDRLAIMPAGTPCSLEDVAARSRRLLDLIEESRDCCEVLIADLPPLSSGVVAARMADLFESVALVVRAGRVSVPRIEKSVSVLNQRPFVILNAEAVSRSVRVRAALSRLRP